MFPKQISGTSTVSLVTVEIEVNMPRIGDKYVRYLPEQQLWEVTDATADGVLVTCRSDDLEEDDTVLWLTGKTLRRWLSRSHLVLTPIVA